MSLTVMYLMERHLTEVVKPRNHHARHPERNDVAARHEHAGRIVVLQLRRLLRPAQRRMRPEHGAEPGVEDVGVLDEAKFPKVLLIFLIPIPSSLAEKDFEILAAEGIYGFQALARWDERCLSREINN